MTCGGLAKRVRGFDGRPLEGRLPRAKVELKLSVVHWWTVFVMLRCPMEERERAEEGGAETHTHIRAGARDEARLQAFCLYPRPRPGLP